MLTILAAASTAVLAVSLHEPPQQDDRGSTLLVQADADAKAEAQAEFFSKLAGFAKKAMKKAGPMLGNMASGVLSG